ncbi:MAG: hypothetical protein PHH52_03445 [Patescibacteria group bacterium]|jgi:hypothetical protein|nr:hypothetical protein [Patescibacteria group bacterium]MDD3778404.1 hypothetical protein [Patescibacteria group bacterium]MDD4444121.1 hypothetical protein [Patescibacteria group bacterium]NCU40050.1 hypothetical protein [Candidatus Falkowbacteria bacterium]
MNNTMFGKIIAIFLLVAVAGSLVYFHLSMNKMDKKMTELQTTIIETSSATSEVVNFFNANLNAQNNN